MDFNSTIYHFEELIKNLIILSSPPDKQIYPLGWWAL